MSSLDLVKQRGHWFIRVTPDEYQENRVSRLAELEQHLRKASVSLRGWDFPHIGNGDLTRGSNHLELYINWMHHEEFWRAYKSGQFIAYWGVYEDWRDRSMLWPAPPNWSPGQTLSVEDSMYRLVEVYEFTARWATALSVQGSMTIALELNGIDGRILELSPDRAGFHFPKKSSTASWKYSQTYQVSDVVADPRKLAIAPALSLFELFGWDTNEQMLRELQSGLRR